MACRSAHLLPCVALSLAIIAPDANACLAHDIALLDSAPAVRALLGLVADPSANAGRPIAELLGPSSSVGRRAGSAPTRRPFEALSR